MQSGRISKSKVIVALDGMPVQRALTLARHLRGLVWGFKVNDLLFTDIMPKLKRSGRVFADAKLHDIPNSVANSVRRLSSLGVNMITVHSSGGRDMMRAAVKVRGRSDIIAVTVLTSQKGDRLLFKKRVSDARASGVQGIVCSAHELPVNGMKTIVPGIRPDGYSKKDDQKRTATPKQAIGAGADYLVIGRPITDANNPLMVLRDMMNI